MADTKFTIASAALNLAGGQGVSSFGTGDEAVDTMEQVLCHRNYENIVDECLSAHPWRFATKYTQLSRDVDDPDGPWSASYTAPSDMILLQKVITEYVQESIPFDRFQNKIYCNAGSTETIYAVHTYQPAISYWPPYFKLYVKFRLASIFAFPLSANEDVVTGFRNEAEDQFRKAKAYDSRQQTTRRVRLDGRNTIIEARRITR